jgi:hypothetical protein
MRILKRFFRTILAISIPSMKSFVIASARIMRKALVVIYIGWILLVTQVFSLAVCFAQETGRRSTGRVIYALPGYNELGSKEIVVERLLIKNVDPDSALRVSYVLLRNANRELIGMLEGYFYSGTAEYKDSKDSKVGPLSLVTFRTRADSGPLFSYFSDKDLGRPIFVVGWEAERNPVIPPVIGLS